MYTDLLGASRVGGGARRHAKDGPISGPKFRGPSIYYFYTLLAHPAKQHRVFLLHREPERFRPVSQF